MKQLYIGNESIAFQSGAFFKDVTAIIQAIRDNKNRTVQDMAKYLLRLDKCVYDHTGVNLNSSTLDEYDDAFVVVPMLTKGNVLNRDSFNKYIKKHWDADTLSFYNVEKKGWIDPANSRVGGAFSEIVFSSFVSTDHICSKKYTAEETAFVVIHEVGHAYTFLQSLTDTLIVNAVLQRTYQELTSNGVDKKVKVILTKAADSMNIKGREWLEAINDDSDGDVAFKLLVTAVNIEPRGMDNKRYFTQNAAEELADIFAVRHGAGRALVSMRAKNDYSVSESYLLLRNSAWAIQWALWIPLFPIIGGVLALGSLFSVGRGLHLASNARDVTQFKHEAQKARNQFVEHLKISKLPKEQIAAIIDDINFTDKTIQDYQFEDNEPMIVKFMDMFRRGKMTARASREYTDKLEVLVANDLFIRAAQLGSA